ncbi:transposase [Streptomyces coffeae]|uniref:Transposase n=1 Tax=Streptomyces coffeae TaxID=621382 RepID=A0ABS1NE26_9ACTN|nr:transposase [Streptomyces coffeae]MBL1098311.1 transposase [Streptomyces coffeae]
MASGADSIDDLAMLRHGAMPAVFGGIRAPSTLGTFLRAFTHEHALQLDAVHRRFLAELATHTPLLPGAGEVAFVDVDSTHKRVYDRAKQGGEYGRFKGVRTLHPLLATVCTPQSRPVIAGARLRRGKAAASRGAPKFVSEALATAREANCTGTRILRADSQFYNAGVIAACRRAGAHFSVTTGMNPSIKRAVLNIPHDAWLQISYATAVPDPDTGELIFDTEVAEISNTPRSPAGGKQIGSPPG